MKPIALYRKSLENFKLIFHPTVINAFIFLDDELNVLHKNWGDDLNYYFLKEIIKGPIIMFNKSSLAFRLNLKNYLVIGSTIDMLCRENSIIWGAGIIDGNRPLKIKPQKVYAVRGPLTRMKLINEGVQCPPVYGDPAMLTKLYYKPIAQKRYKYGIISHVSNQYYIKKLSLSNYEISKRDDTLIIDLSKYNDWRNIIDEICSCEIILSSSLHGLIISETFNIPNIWIEFGEPLIGGHFKFHDFFQSIHKDRDSLLISNNISESLISEELKKWRPGIIDLKPLLDSCPFKLKKPQIL